MKRDRLCEFLVEIIQQNANQIVLCVNGSILQDRQDGKQSPSDDETRSNPGLQSANLRNSNSYAIEIHSALGAANRQRSTLLKSSLRSKLSRNVCC
jgi:hypothetical protein